MTLPTPGVSLSLSQIQGEFGGANPISLSEYYAGGVTGYVPAGTTGTYGAVPSSGTISIRNFYGTSKTETQTVTVGTLSVKGVTQWGFGTGFGSISDGTFGFISNATINYLGWINTGSQLAFQIAGIYPNSGWTKVTISGTDFLRSAATFSTSTGPDRTIWSWPSVSNPFGTTVGASVPAVFTQ